MVCSRGPNSGLYTMEGLRTQTLSSLLCLNQANTEMSVKVTYYVVSFRHRMDDIQLCKDIMDLKQELQNLVAIPGKVGLHPLLAIAQGSSLPSGPLGLGRCGLSLFPMRNQSCSGGSGI